MLDGAPPGALDPLFFKTITTEGVLDPFRRLGSPGGGRVLIAPDGTEYFCSRGSTRKCSDGGTEHFHAFLGASIVALLARSYRSQPRPGLSGAVQFRLHDAKASWIRARKQRVG